MSARRWWMGPVLAVALVAGAAGIARAQTVVARIGGQLVARPGQTIDVPVTVDLSNAPGAPGVRLGSYRGEIRFDPDALSYDSVLSGTFAAPLVNTDSVYNGLVRFTAVLPTGAPGPVITLFVARFRVDANTETPLTLSFDEMSAAGMPFTNLLPYLQSIQPATVCPSVGTWGDADGDGNANSRDALIALSQVVGIPVAVASPELADVDGDGRVTSRDALIIMSYAVGLPVTGYRIGLAAAGACGSWAGVGLRITPDTVELQSQQTFDLTVAARDSAGRSVAVDTVRWTSSNPAVASVTVDYNSGASRVFARDPGWTILSAEVGAGYRAAAAVHVVARRSQWYVDIQRAGRTSYQQQAGDQRLPFAFIQDALDIARDGDTINVAFGVYPEAVSSDLSVFLRGDAVNRPVIDPRGADSYDGGPALNLGSSAGALRIENFHIIGGGIEAYASAFVGRSLLVDSVVGADASVYVYGAGSGTPSGALYRTPSVDLDGIEVRGFQDRGIWIQFADSVVIQHSTVQGDPTYPDYSSCYAGPGSYPEGNGYGGIMIDEASYSRLVSNTVTDAKCSGIAVFQTAGQAVLSGSRVTGAGGVGIVVSAPQVALDHNAVRDVRNPEYVEGPRWNGRQSAGIWVSSWNSVDSVKSLADTVRDVGGSGFLVDTTRTAVLDSLVIDGAGTVSQAAYAHGAALYSGRYTVQHSRISNTYEDGLSVCGPTAALFSQGNHITSPGSNGISTLDCYAGEGSGDGPDTLVSVRDTVEFTPNMVGILSADARYARVDSAVVSGTGTNSADGVAFDSVDTAVLRDSKISNVGYDGVAVFSGARALLERDTITSVGGIGVYFDSIDSTVLRDSKISNVGSDGVYVYSGARALFERNTISSVGCSGVYFESIDSTVLRDSKISDADCEGIYVYGGTGALLERDTIELIGSEGLVLLGTADTTRVRQTVVTNSGLSGIRVDYGAVIRADTIAVTGSGDLSSSLSSGLSFDNNSGGRITGSRLEGNSHYGVRVYSTNPGVVVLSHNSLASNDSGGVRFSVPYPSWSWPDTLDASFNWWGVATGPVPVNEDTLTYGYITSDSASAVGPVNFSNFLTARPTFPPPIAAPPMQLARAVRPVASAAARGAEGSVERQRPDRAARQARISRAAARPALQAAARPAPRPAATVARAHARPPLVTYRKGAPPRPATVHHR